MKADMPHADELRSLLLQDRVRMEALRAVAALGLEGCWTGAGLVCDAVWDYLHQRPFKQEKRAIVDKRVRRTGWLARYPRLVLHAD